MKKTKCCINCRWGREIICDDRNRCNCRLWDKFDIDPMGICESFDEPVINVTTRRLQHYLDKNGVRI